MGGGGTVKGNGAEGSGMEERLQAELYMEVPVGELGDADHCMVGADEPADSEQNLILCIADLRV